MDRTQIEPFRRLLSDIEGHLLFLESGGIRSVPRTGDVETFLQGIGQGSAKPGKSMSAKKKREALENLRRELGDCKRCKLCRERDKIVFGAGNPDADLVFVGEGAMRVTICCGWAILFLFAPVAGGWGHARR